MKYPLVRVEWLDIVANKNWMDLKESISWAKRMYKQSYHTEGRLIYKDDKLVIVASTYETDEGEDSFNDVSMIPRSVVKKIIKL